MPGTTGDVHYDFTQFALDRSQTRLTGNLRTSIIVDPPDGSCLRELVPMQGPLEPRRLLVQVVEVPVRRRSGAGPLPVAGRGAGGGAAERRAGGGRGAAAGGGAGGGGGGGGADAQYDPCKTSRLDRDASGPPSAAPIMMPPGYNPAYQIIQGPGVVMILIENQHEVRVIPTDNRPHAPSAVKPWLGDSTGRWEGNTLVVETMNFNPRTLTGTFQGTSPDMKVIERFTRINEDSFKYSSRSTIRRPGRSPGRAKCHS